MDVDCEEGPVFIPKVMCCMCGLLIDSNPSNMCPSCIRAHVDITDGLIKEYIIVFCPECERYLQPPKFWIKADLESRELMTLCLKKVKGLSKYTLADASFVWTEPHSKRLILKLTLQKEIFTNTIIQQTAVINYVVNWQQCERCQKAATGQPQWDAVVQLRQRVDHKRTFLYMEQIILKHRMHEDTNTVEVQPEGLDFYYAHRSHALKFLDFISNYCPVHRNEACQLVSHDSKSNTAVQHHAYALEIAPLCREDLVCLPTKHYTQMGAIGPMVLVYKVYSSIVFVDPSTLRAGDVTNTVYWKNPFNAFATSRQMVEFYVIDVIPSGVVNGKFQLATVQVCPANEVGEGREWIVTSHLGNILHPGDSAKGYYIPSINHNNEDIEKYHPDQIPEVILVHKHFPNQKRRRRKRSWHIKTIPKEEGGAANNKTQQAALAEDYETFYDELERDPEYRQGVPLYVDKAAIARQAAKQQAGTAESVDGEGEEYDGEEAKVDLAELLDELKINDEEEEEAEPPVPQQEFAAPAVPQPQQYQQYHQ